MKTFSYTAHSKQVLGDMHTPVSIYLKVRDMYPQSALMESSDYHAGENSLSFIALCPLASIGINNGECTAVFPDGKSEVTALTGTFNVAEAMNAFLKRFSIEGPDRKVCGLFGYTAFDAVRYFENIPVMEAHHEENDAPDMLYILYKYVLVFNHFKNELTLVELMQSGENSGLQEIETLIENRNYASYNFQATGPETSPVSGEEYKAMVREGIRHFDILRWFIPVYHATADGQRSELTPEDDRRVIQLPQVVSLSGVEQNPWSNVGAWY